MSNEKTEVRKPIQVYLNEDERELIEKASSKTGLSLNAFFRSNALKAARETLNDV